MATDKGILAIVDKLPPPDKLRRGGDADSAPDDAGDDYDPAVESMTAFMKAVKGDDAAAALDAYRDVMKNC
jgi:hypothetical protein